MKLELLNCDENILKLILEGNDALSKKLKINIPQKWTELDEYTFNQLLKIVLLEPVNKHWWAYLAINTDDNTLIGSCGYKGIPDESGVVEIGYEVAEKFRNLGAATEMTNLLVIKAFLYKEVNKVQAFTKENTNASAKVLIKNKFKLEGNLENSIGEFWWKWELEKQSII